MIFERLRLVILILAHVVKANLKHAIQRARKGRSNLHCTDGYEDGEPECYKQCEFCKSEVYTERFCYFDKKTNRIYGINKWDNSPFRIKNTMKYHSVKKRKPELHPHVMRGLLSRKLIVVSEFQSLGRRCNKIHHNVYYTKDGEFIIKETEDLINPKEKVIKNVTHWFQPELPNVNNSM